MGSEFIVAVFHNSDGNVQIVTEGSGAMCPVCGYPERHRVYADPGSPNATSDGCPSCETTRMPQSTVSEHTEGTTT